jgi:hypothetical protein
LGPQIPWLGLSYSNIFRDGIHENLYPAIAQCPALGEMFIPIKDLAAVRKELNFDIARNMRGTTGKFVTFYREIQKWIATRKQKEPSIGVKTHA